MIVTLKTKEELLKAGWKENTRATHWRLYHPMFGGGYVTQWYNRPRQGRLNVGNVENDLGQKFEVRGIREVKKWNDEKCKYINVTMLDLSRGEGCRYVKISVTKDAVHGFSKKEWNQFNKFKKTKFKLDGKPVKLSLNGEVVKVGLNLSFKRSELIGLAKKLEARK